MKYPAEQKVHPISVAHDSIHPIVSQSKQILSLNITHYVGHESQVVKSLAQLLQFSTVQGLQAVKLSVKL